MKKPLIFMVYNTAHSEPSNIQYIQGTCRVQRTSIIMYIQGTCRVQRTSNIMYIQGTCRVQRTLYLGGERVTSPLPHQTMDTAQLPDNWDWRNVSG